MPDSAQTLTDASVKVVDRQTLMKFTKIVKETNEIANTFLWAYGLGNTLRFHSTRSPFDLNLSSGLATEVVVPNYSAWLAHGIMAFLAWGVLLFRDRFPKGPLWFNPQERQFWRLCSSHCPFLYCSFIHNEGRDSQL